MTRFERDTWQTNADATNLNADVRIALTLRANILCNGIQHKIFKVTLRGKEVAAKISDNT
jgi:hypothetical protein